MPKYLLSFLFALGVINAGFAQDVTFENALRAVRVNCSGISDKLSEIKNWLVLILLLPGLVLWLVPVQLQQVLKKVS